MLPYFIPSHSLSFKEIGVYGAKGLAGMLRLTIGLKNLKYATIPVLMVTLIIYGMQHIEYSSDIPDAS